MLSCISVVWFFLLINSAKCGKFVSQFEITHDDPCPCSNAQWCNPVTDTTRKEVFAFSIVNDDKHWNLFDWSRLTTIVMFGYVNDSLMCLAHSHDVRVVILGDVNEATFIDPSKRQTWIAQQFQLVKSHYLDGLNFDFEGAVGSNETTVRDAYTSLVKETNAYFKSRLPYSQISVDVGWKPNVDIRYYDYKGLSDNSDLLFVMAYDEQSQIYGECLALPNSAISNFILGLKAYWNITNQIEMNKKLVLGVPWYGYIYPCLKTDGDKCYIKEVPFRGVNCSDAAGRQYDYSYIYTLEKTFPKQYVFNTSSGTPYLTYQNSETNTTYQIQYDDPKSLKLKYVIAETMDVRGVGMWNIDSLDYSDTESGRHIRDAMFGALPPRSNGSYSKGHSLHFKSSCPCSNPDWCKPITDVTRKEVYAFSLTNDESYWNKFDWSKITTVCMFGYVNTSLMCLAHSHNVRAVVLAKGITTIMMITPALRTAWINQQIAIVQNNFLDGLNFDLEDAISPQQSALRNAYTALAVETSQALKKANPYAQFSIDVIINAYSQYRDYDYPALAAASDFLFIMAYDETGFNSVGTNSGYHQAINGINTYIARNISASKLVLGLPWYGYVYYCSKLVNDTCTLDKSLHPPGSQNGYSDIYYLLKPMPDRYRWDSQAETPYFTYKNNVTGKSYDIQYDDPKSLALKYELASNKGIRGVGFWTIDFLDYSDTAEAEAMRKSMFDPLPAHG